VAVDDIMITDVIAQPAARKAKRRDC